MNFILLLSMLFIVGLFVFVSVGIVAALCLMVCSLVKHFYKSHFNENFGPLV